MPNQVNEKKRIRYSRFLITWNSNTPVYDTNNPEFKDLESKAETFWNTMRNNIIKYIVIKNVNDTIDKVKAIKTDIAFEIGGEKRMFHSHIFLGIDHYTKVQIDLDLLRKDIIEIFAGSYINVMSGNDSTLTIQDYISKYNIKNFAK